MKVAINAGKRQMGFLQGEFNAIEYGIFATRKKALFPVLSLLPS